MEFPLELRAAPGVTQADSPPTISVQNLEGRDTADCRSILLRRGWCLKPVDSVVK